MRAAVDLLAALCAALVWLCGVCLGAVDLRQALHEHGLDE